MTPEDLVPMTRQQIKEIKVLASMLEETAGKLDKLATRRHPDLVDATWLVRSAQKNVDRVIMKLT